MTTHPPPCRPAFLRTTQLSEVERRTEAAQREKSGWERAHAAAAERYFRQLQRREAEALATIGAQRGKVRELEEALAAATATTLAAPTTQRVVAASASPATAPAGAAGVVHLIHRAEVLLARRSPARSRRRRGVPLTPPRSPAHATTGSGRGGGGVAGDGDGDGAGAGGGDGGGDGRGMAGAATGDGMEDEAAVVAQQMQALGPVMGAALLLASVRCLQRLVVTLADSATSNATTAATAATTTRRKGGRARAQAPSTAAPAIGRRHRPQGDGSGSSSSGGGGGGHRVAADVAPVVHELSSLLIDCIQEQETSRYTLQQVLHDLAQARHRNAQLSRRLDAELVTRETTALLHTEHEGETTLAADTRSRHHTVMIGLLDRRIAELTSSLAEAHGAAAAMTRRAKTAEAELEALRPRLAELEARDATWDADVSRHAAEAADRAVECAHGAVEARVEALQAWMNDVLEAVLLSTTATTTTTTTNNAAAAAAAAAAGTVPPSSSATGVGVATGGEGGDKAGSLARDLVVQELSSRVAASELAQATLVQRYARICWGAVACVVMRSALFI